MRFNFFRGQFSALHAVSTEKVVGIFIVIPLCFYCYKIKLYYVCFEGIGFEFTLQMGMKSCWLWLFMFHCDFYSFMFFKRCDTDSHCVLVIFICYRAVGSVLTMPFVVFSSQHTFSCSRAKVYAAPPLITYRAYGNEQLLVWNVHLPLQQSSLLSQNAIIEC